MSNRPRQDRRAGQPGAAVGVVTDERDGDGGAPADGGQCTCCTPTNPLVMRPDLGTLADRSAEYALCVLHDPEPVVYRNRGDGVYVQMPHLKLNAAGDIVDEDGQIIARVSGDGFQRLSTVDDDDDPPSADPGGGASESEPQPGTSPRPGAFHVDLSQDDFYRLRQ